MIKTDTLVIGAGLTGLSCAYHLEKLKFRDYLLVEKSPVYGGLCGSVSRDGFTFDYSGHLLHLHTEDGRRLVKELLGGNIALLRRSAWIFSHKTFTPYPFQAGIYGLPPRVVSECVLEFIKAHRENRELPYESPFGDWARSVFGEGICRHFMFPYNLKLWRTPLSELTADWCAPFVPRPKLDEVIRGAYWPQKKTFGYNAVFYYPERGGCRALCDALAAKIPAVKTGCALESVNFKTRVATIKNLGQVRFSRVINTMPLREFISLAENCPVSVRRCASRLKATPVAALNLGIDRAVPDRHWVYFPEKEFPFYRAGIASNFSKHVAPKGASSFYIEVSRMEGRPFRPESLEPEILSALRKCGLLRKTDRILSKLWLDMPCAYVVYDKRRRAAVEDIMRFLEKNRALSIGRYGGWKYSVMEEAMLEGRAAAGKIKSRAL